ncbi:MAG TPA: hypothetical protein VHT04_02395 [Stellaceae bacterium]|jgi:hypothetical protein|nr:hypothetical protein [Stellaceae bacterium]
MTMRNLVFLTVLAVSVGAGPGARAAGQQPAWPGGDQLANDLCQAGELIRQGLDKALGSIDTALRTMPRYELPTIDEDGNIIIRRKPPGTPGSEPERPGRTI